MVKTLRQILKLIDKDHKSIFFKLQILNFLSAIIEVIALGLLALFVSIINDFSFIEKLSILDQFYKNYFISQKSFLVYFGILVTFFYLLASISSIYMNWSVSKFTQILSNYFSNKLYNFYIESNWLYFVNFDPIKIANNIITNLRQVTERIFQSYLNITHKLVVAVSVSVTVFIFNKQVATIGVTIFFIIYFIMFNLIKKMIKEQSQKQLALMKSQHQLINKTFNAMKEVIIFNLQDSLRRKFKNINSENLYPQTLVRSINQLPRLFIEMLSYIVVISFITIFIYSNSNYQDLLPLIAIYAFAGLKLLPAFQQIYLAAINIRVGRMSFDLIKSDLFKSIKISLNKKKENEKIKFENTISINDLDLSYDKNIKVLKNINFKIKKNTIVGIVGKTGSGKTSLVDLILGLIKPSKGQVLIDKEPLNSKNIRKWQNNLSFVSQFPYFLDTSIENNIIFSRDKERIDQSLLLRSITSSQLTNLIKKRKKGIKSKIGDRGVKFSGGERQRIAIARALYRDSSILILDEATSALDLITEQKIMRNIKNIHPKKTVIIISHRINTLKSCDKIIVLNNGEIVGDDSYKKLLKNNSYFKKLTSGKI
jgi:ATP-binding cassette, subfamily B, bacterial PglK